MKTVSCSALTSQRFALNPLRFTLTPLRVFFALTHYLLALCKDLRLPLTPCRFC